MSGTRFAGERWSAPATPAHAIKAIVGHSIFMALLCARDKSATSTVSGLDLTYGALATAPPFITNDTALILATS
jgi:hypothetical protein